MTSAIESESKLELKPFAYPRDDTKEHVNKLGQEISVCKNCNGRITLVSGMMWRHNSTQMLSCYPFGRTDQVD